jgi:hypothetical protein
MKSPLPRAGPMRLIARDRPTDLSAGTIENIEKLRRHMIISRTAILLAL